MYHTGTGFSLPFGHRPWCDRSCRIAQKEISSNVQQYAEIMEPPEFGAALFLMGMVFSLSLASPVKKGSILIFYVEIAGEAALI